MQKSFSVACARQQTTANRIKIVISCDSLTELIRKKRYAVMIFILADISRLLCFSCGRKRKNLKVIKNSPLPLQPRGKQMHTSKGSAFYSLVKHSPLRASVIVYLLISFPGPLLWLSGRGEKQREQGCL